MSMMVLGVDPGSSHVGLALLEIYHGGGARWVSCETLSPDAVTPGVFATYKSAWDVHTVVVEAPVGRPGPWIGPVVETAMIAGEVFGICETLGLRPQYVLCRDWRKALTGKGNADDATVKAAMLAQLEVPKRTNAHVRDAAGAALVCGRLTYDGWTPGKEVEDGG